MDVRGAVTAPRVSVLLPVYGGAAHIGAAVESVLSQTFADFELLVLDDCSPDASVAIVEAFGDPRVRVVRNERNLGQVATLNRGLHEAHGEYAARVDQDDVCLPTRFERQVELLDAEPSVAAVGTWLEIVDENDRPIDELCTPLDGQADTVFLVLVDHLPLAHPSVMVRRADVLEADGYDEAVRYCEDMDLWRRLALSGRSLRVVPEQLVRYRRHEGQQSHRFAAEQRANNERSLERFVAALAPGVDARLVRMAFTRQVDLWQELSDVSDSRRLAAGLETLLERASERFALTQPEREQLSERVRDHVAAIAVSGWRTGVRRYWRISPPLARFGARRPATRLRYAAACAAAPLLVAARASMKRLAGSS